MSINFYDFSKLLENNLDSKRKEAAGLWKANSLLVRKAYLKGHPQADKLSSLSWEELPKEAQELAMRDMFGRSPFKEQ
jgi:hypothetical protein